MNEKKIVYRGYSGSVEYDESAKLFYGELLDVGSYIFYNAPDLVGLEEDFKSAVDGYIDFREELERDGIEKWVQKVNMQNSKKNTSEVTKTDEKPEEIPRIVVSDLVASYA
jgi:predicted HicB family RNase H-like nuclease